MTKLVFQTENLTLKREDGGCALIGEVTDGAPEATPSEVFVRIHSWDDDKNHPDIRQLEGKRVRVTIEVI